MPTSRSPCVEVVSRPGLGRCFISTRPISPGAVIISEEPLLLTEPEGAEVTDAVDAILRAFCVAPSAVQAAVIASLATIEYDKASTLATAARNEAKRLEGTYGNQPLSQLEAAIMAFRLNGHSFGKRSALFSTLCRMQHGCDPCALYNRSADGKRGQYVALRFIATGELVSMNYLGPEQMLGHRFRRALLSAQKLFVCECERCRGPDWSATVPCPSCHPRQSDGSLPVDAQDGASKRVMYAVSTAGGLETSRDEEGACWRCAACGGQFSSAAMFAIPASDDGRPLGRQLESRLSTIAVAAERDFESILADDDDDDGGVASVPYAAILDRLNAARRVLGGRHWATAKLLQLHSDWIMAQLALPAAKRARDVPTAQAVLTTLQGISDELWAFCAQSQLPPFTFAAFGRILSQLVRMGVCVSHSAYVRGLTVCAGPVSGSRGGSAIGGVGAAAEDAGSSTSTPLDDPQQIAIMRRLGSPGEATYEDVADVLAVAAQGALDAGQSDEALMLARHAQLHNPRSEVIGELIQASLRLVRQSRPELN